MDETERTDLLRELRETEAAFLESLEGVGEAQARFRPTPDRWSILECVEHVARVETILLGNLTDATSTPSAAPPPARNLEPLIRQRGTDRTLRFEAPEGARPVGRSTSLAKEVNSFRQARARSATFVRGCRADLRALAVNHPVVGTITAQECLLLLIIHPARHAAQVSEICQSPSFPQAERRSASQ